MRALHEASAYDDEAARVWREFHEPVIAAFAGLTQREIARGRVVDIGEVEPMVRALVGMNLYCFFDRVVGNPDVDVEATADTLLKVWARTWLPP